MTTEELKSFPAHTLFDLARNPSAPKPVRLQAAEELMDRDDRRALHDDLVGLVQEIVKRRAGLPTAADLDTAVEEQLLLPIRPENEREMKASFTTANQMQDDVVIRPSVDVPE